MPVGKDVGRFAMFGQTLAQVVIWFQINVFRRRRLARAKTKKDPGMFLGIILLLVVAALLLFAGAHGCSMAYPD